LTKTIKIASVVTVTLLVSVVTISLYIQNYLTSPAGTLTEAAEVEINPGSSFHYVTSKLKEAGVIESRDKFYLYAKYRGDLNSIKAGEYSFQPSMTPGEILDHLVKGNVIKHRITIPEGYNLYQVAQLLDERGIVTKDDFIKDSFDKALLDEMGINSKSFEGYLYPETYFLVKGMKGKDIIRRMSGRFKEVFSPELTERADELGFSVEEIINLASIIEKETGNPEERKLISAVFHNRLRKRMRLQSDPTVIYGMIESFDGNIRKKDLKTKTPYNTYRINGLPAGPIANPGIESIEAALYPAPVDYIYFVSMNNGSHVFAKSLEEHNRNVWIYQKRKRR